MEEYPRINCEWTGWVSRWVVFRVVVYPKLRWCKKSGELKVFRDHGSSRDCSSQRPLWYTNQNRKSYVAMVMTVNVLLGSWRWWWKCSHFIINLFSGPGDGGIFTSESITSGQGECGFLSRCVFEVSPLYPNLTIDLCVRIATGLHQSFLWLHPIQA